MRLLLIELLNDDAFHQHRSEYFPFYQGLVRSRGGSCAWVSLAAGRALRPRHPFLVELDKTALRLVERAIREVRPTHAVLSETISDGNANVLRRAAPAAVFLVPPAVPFDKWTALAAVPAYDARRLDPGKPTAEHFLQIILEPRCRYRKAVQRNPHFAGLDLSRAISTVGCSFCVKRTIGRYSSTPAVSADEALARALLQFRRYDETACADGRTRRFLMFVAPLLRRIGRLFAGFLELGLPAAELWLTCRIDELLAMEDDLRAWLPRLAAGGHSLHLWQMGLENFSPVENERFNKGITTAQIEAAVALLRDLEEAWPGTFVARRYGFAMILFTPWTRLEDLRINAEAVGRLGIAAPVSMRLQIRAGTPIELLARRDGLLLRARTTRSDPFATVCIAHWGEDELPWRFRHPEVGRAYAVLAALFPSSAPPRDSPLAARVEVLRRRAAASLSEPGRVLGALVDILETSPETSTAALLEALIDRCATRAPAEQPGGAAAGRGPSWTEFLVRLLRRLIRPRGSSRTFAGSSTRWLRNSP